MIIPLIQGEFSHTDTLDLISQMIQVKIRYHENKINSLGNEEDIKSRETKIKRLQNALSEARNNILLKKETLRIEALIHIE